MNVIPIQVTEDGVVIPRIYLGAAEEFELVLEEEFVLVRPRDASVLPPDATSARFPWIGIGVTRDPTAAERVEEILEAEIDRKAGWTLDK
jgi:hypothetical protein